jgi:hypothetical protein
VEYSTSLFHEDGEINGKMLAGLHEGPGQWTQWVRM